MRLLKLFLILPIFLILMIVVLGYFDPDCNFRVGRMIESCFPGERGTANYWYERAAQKGHTLGLSYAGMYYLYGFGPQNKGKGIDYLEKAAKDNDLYAKGCLALAYEWGLGVEQDFVKSKDLTKNILKEYEEQEIAGERKAKAKARLAYLYTVSPPPVRDFEKGLQLWQELIDESELEENPAESIGLHYYYGLSGKRDFLKAAKFLEPGAKLGGKQARQCIGNCYLSGLGVKRNYKLANKWLNLAAEEGSFVSQEILAVARAIGIPEISESESNKKWNRVLEKRGFQCFNYLNEKKFGNSQAAIQSIRKDSKSDSRAATILGVIYQYGIGLPEDLELAAKYFKEAQDGGSDDAKVILATEIFQSPGPMEKLKEGTVLINEACKNKHKEAFVIRAMNQTGGITCKQNWSEAYNTLSSIELEHELEAEFFLSQCYVYGLGTRRDAKKGLKLLYDMALMGYSEPALYLVNNIDTFDNRDKVKIDKIKMFAACEKAEIPELQYNWALIEKDKEKARTLLVEASNNGYDKAKSKISERGYFNGRKSVDEVVDQKDTKQLLKKPLVSIEKQITEFRNNFVRETDSRLVLKAVKDLKKGDLITKDSYESVESDFVLGTYLDGSPVTLNFVNGKTCNSDISKGSEISVYDIGLPEKSLSK